MNSQYKSKITTNNTVPAQGLQSRKEVDMAIHEIVGVNYLNYPTTWRQKNHLTKSEAAFISALKEALENRT